MQQPSSLNLVAGASMTDQLTAEHHRKQSNTTTYEIHDYFPTRADPRP
jgi:hypothetical protein